MSFSQTILMVTLKIWDEFYTGHTEVMLRIVTKADCTPD